ncbi:hypothetical protein J8J14_10210 [Roseomonas sp. SSH11]|uniref:Uncharacterized protein n=1 Tax=Pararoseomonas baculiformis TaxID=2820812 RepID=A0ABS4ADR8_9PROT|nr:hypothetical protein [Pararoseomonas baculiformis]MBP0445153.1 hypothetical protein [Pararoseomonas baculiformis]
MTIVAHGARALSVVIPFRRRPAPALTLADVETLGAAISRYALAGVAGSLPGLPEMDTCRAAAMQSEAIEQTEEAIRAIDARLGLGTGETLVRLIRSRLAAKLTADEARATEWDAVDAAARRR